MEELVIIGGGLAGSEAAWQAAQAGVNVILFEMRPSVQTGAHTGAWLGELVCSNSLGSNLINRASGLLKEELRQLGSMVIACADETALPAGGALAVDREAFGRLVTEKLNSHSRIKVQRDEATAIPVQPTIIASGPLTSPNLSRSIATLTGQDHLYFFDAIAPIVIGETVNLDIAFRASRYERGSLEEGDYINCPFTQVQYENFVRALVDAETIKLREFETGIATGVRLDGKRYFEGCLPIEILGKRNPASLAYGPMRPIGIYDPRTKKRPYAVVQLRQDDRAKVLYNLVGFQTNLTYSEQNRIFRMIPGLEAAQFVRYGQMHRNTFINSPQLLQSSMQYNLRDDLFFAGQITGVEGYAGNIGTGLLAGMNAARVIRGGEPLKLPEESILGALCEYVTRSGSVDFQPMKANFGLLSPIDSSEKTDRNTRGFAYAERSLAKISEFMKYL